MIVGIIGGTGAMGTLFREVFERAGHRVLISGRHTPRSNTDLARESDIVMVSVPIDATAGVIKEIAPLLTSDQVICDVTSLKVEPVRAMMESEAQVIGMHPMFGPGIASLQGQTLIVTPARCDAEVLQQFLAMFRCEGAEITITSPEEHDRMMAVVQGLTHFTTLALAGTMRRLEIDLDAVLPFMSPVYRIELDIIGRILGQDPALYGAILQQNPAVPEVLEMFGETADQLRHVVGEGDRAAFAEYFRKNSAFFSPYIPKATRESDHLIESLVNL